MKLQRISLRNFRNVENSTLEADPHLNVLTGKNGQGKTSFLEAIFYLATLRSFRGAKSEEVVRWGSDHAEISATVNHGLQIADPWSTELKVVFNIPGRSPDPFIQINRRPNKAAFINGKLFKSSTQYLSRKFGSVEVGFHAVAFNPSDHDLVRGEPALRRSYLDQVLSAENIGYLQTLQKYKRVLDQRNSLLRADETPSPELLSGFTEPLCTLGALITFHRLEWISKLQFRLNEVVHSIAPKQPKLSLFQLSNWVPETTGFSLPNKTLGSLHFTGLPNPASLEILEQAFRTQLARLREAEVRARSTLVGPHRDDWMFFLGDQVLKGHGSQGEVRSALLALKLCEIELFKEKTGHRPLLLLDDFSSELDRDRRAFLLRFLSETDIQVFVTTTEDSITSGKRFLVSNGNIELDWTGKESHDGAADQPKSE